MLTSEKKGVFLQKCGCIVDTNNHVFNEELPRSS